MYFTSDRPGGLGRSDVWVTSRKDLVSSWATPTLLKSLSTTGEDAVVAVRGDDREIFVTVGTGRADLWAASRGSPTSPWGALTQLSVLASGDWDGAATVTGDGLELFMASNRLTHDNDCDIFRSTRASTTSTWAVPALVSELSLPTHFDGSPSVSTDGLLMMFASSRPGGAGGQDLWIAARANRSVPFGKPTWVKELATSERDCAGQWTSDTFSYYFSRTTSQAIYRADRILPLCIPTGLPTRGQPFDIACRRDPGDVGMVIGSLWTMPPLRISGVQGFLNIHPAGIVWQAVGKVGNMGRFTTRLPIPNVATLKGVPIHWQVAAQDPVSKVYISPLVTTVIQ